MIPTGREALHSDETRTQRSAVTAGAVGSIVEWYDFAIYGFFAASIGKLFFPAQVPVVSLIAAFAVFAVGYAARPLGSLVFGLMGDRVGRARALTVSVIAMGASTTIIAVLPTYAQAGVAAPVLLLILRIGQGMAAGGEYSGASVYVAEHAKPRWRAFITSFIEFGVLLGFILGSTIGLLTSAMLGDAAIADWGWRIPFALGGILALAVLLARRRMPEAFQISLDAKRTTSPVVEIFQNHWRTLVHIAVLVAYTTTAFNVVWVYSATFLHQTLKFSFETTLGLYIASLVVMAVVAPLAGYMSDRLGRRSLFLFVACCGLILSWPLFYLLHQPSIGLVLLAQCGFAVLVGTCYGMVPATIAEMLPAHVRCTGAAIGYNVCVGLVGGTAPLVSASMVAQTGDPLAPAFYLMLLAMVMLVGVRYLREYGGRAI